MRNEGTHYYTTIQKPAPPVDAIRARELDWNALSFDDRLAVLAEHRGETTELSNTARTFLRRHGEAA